MACRGLLSTQTARAQSQLPALPTDSGQEAPGPPLLQRSHAASEWQTVPRCGTGSELRLPACFATSCPLPATSPLPPPPHFDCSDLSWERPARTRKAPEVTGLAAYLVKERELLQSPVFAHGGDGQVFGTTEFHLLLRRESPCHGCSVHLTGGRVHLCESHNIANTELSRQEPSSGAGWRSAQHPHGCTSQDHPPWPPGPSAEWKSHNRPAHNLGSKSQRLSACAIRQGHQSRNSKGVMPSDIASETSSPACSSHGL